MTQKRTVASDDLSRNNQAHHIMTAKQANTQSTENHELILKKKAEELQKLYADNVRLELEEHKKWQRDFNAVVRSGIEYNVKNGNTSSVTVIYIKTRLDSDIFLLSQFKYSKELTCILTELVSDGYVVSVNDKTVEVTDYSQFGDPQGSHWERRTDLNVQW